MIWLVAVAVGALVAAGVYLALSRDIVRMVIGISLIGAGANLVVLGAGRLGAAVPAIVPAGERVLAAVASNPLPQALVLTAIVISFSLTCFSLCLVLAVSRSLGTVDSEGLDAAEPTAGLDGTPVSLDEVVES